MVNRSPSHYTRGSIEVWDFIRDQQLNYHLGNAIKYICRAGYKSPTTKTEDLKKAIHYLENELQNTLSEDEPIRPSHSVPFSLWDYELHGEPDYATGFDR
jgi:hypothetical protein